MSILSQIAVTQAQALASSTLGRFDFFVDSSDNKLKAYDDTNTLVDVGGINQADEIDYTLTVPSDWDGTPANVQDALDELASRVKGIEGKTDLITVTSAIDLDDVKSKSDSALQSGDNVSELVNDVGYTTAQGLPSVLNEDDKLGNNNIVLDPLDGAQIQPPSRGAIMLKSPTTSQTRSVFFLEDSTNTKIEVITGSPSTTGVITIFGENQSGIRHSGTLNGLVANSTGCDLRGVLKIPSNTGFKLQDGGNEIIFSASPTASNRTQTFQDASGVIALLSDISGSGVSSVTGDGVDNTDPSNPVLSFPDADEIDDSTTTSKFATQPQLDAISTNTQEINLNDNKITVLANSKLDGVTGDGVNNLDPLNPVLSFPNPNDIGLGNVDNTSDANKPVSTATQNAINLKRDLTAQKNSIESDGGDLQLVNDEATPTANKNYGTDENGNKGFKNDVRYSKVVSFEDSNLNNFSSNVFTDIPDMQLAIDRDGDYTFVATVNCNNDQNEEIDLTIGLTPITNRVINLPDGTTVTVNAGTQFVSDFQQVRDRQQKNQDQTLSGTFLLDALEDGDLVDFLLNTRNDNVDLENRRAYGYTINNND